MNNAPRQGSITGLTFSLSSDEKNKTKAYFNLKGRLSVDETKNMISDFQKVVTEFDIATEMKEVSENNRGINENQSEINRDQDEMDDYVDSVDPVELQDEDNSSDDEKYPEPNQSVMLYPVRATITPGGITSQRNAILQSWNTFSSIKITCSQPRYVNRVELFHYRIVFPVIKPGFPGIIMKDLNMDIPLFFQRHSYPVCSCPSYHYKSYNDIVNGEGVSKCCKHITGVLAVANFPFELINWENRPDNLPLLLKNEGLDEYQWIH